MSKCCCANCTASVPLKGYDELLYCPSKNTLTGAFMQCALYVRREFNGDN